MQKVSFHVSHAQSALAGMRKNILQIFYMSKKLVYHVILSVGGQSGFYGFVIGLIHVESHLDICVNCWYRSVWAVSAGLSEMALYDFISFCATVGRVLNRTIT